MIIGLTGRIASGKDIVSGYLKSRGFTYFSLSNEVRGEARTQGIELTRKNLQDLGNALRANEGNGVLALKVIKKMSFNVPGNTIIDGIRNSEEVVEFRKKFNENFTLIATDAPQELRFKRVSSRNRESDPKNWDDFLVVDARDFGENSDSGQQVGQCMALANFVLQNDSTLEEFNKKIKSLFEKIGPPE